MVRSWRCRVAGRVGMAAGGASLEGPSAFARQGFVVLRLTFTLTQERDKEALRQALSGHPVLSPELVEEMRA